MTAVDAGGWSGEGTFTQVVLDHLREMPGIRFVRVEDAPATRSEADYNFISNEIFVSFATVVDVARTFRFGVIPLRTTTVRRLMTLEGLERALTMAEAIGAPDYSDEGMLQYLRAERIVPPYQTRGYKLVELVRIYEAPIGT